MREIEKFVRSRERNWLNYAELEKKKKTNTIDTRVHVKCKYTVFTLDLQFMRIFDRERDYGEHNWRGAVSSDIIYTPVIYLPENTCTGECQA